jgi:uncharacterized protein YfaS (alpha-2-macroglobulin family)
MRYLKETGQLTPEWQMKLEHAIHLGVQRLLTFETRADGGGFDWYGEPPAKTILTAYGVMEFADIARIHPVERGVIDRAVAVLKKRQKADGSWELDRPMGTWIQAGGGALPLTAYVAWALLESGQEAGRAVEYLESRLDEAKDPYVLALVANALHLARSRRAAEAIDRLERMATVDDDAATWKTALQGAYYSTGDVASIETTALAALVLDRAKRRLSDKALTALVRARDPQGGWHSTQSTLLAIKALLEAGRSAGRAKEPVAAALRVNGREVEGAFRPVGAENFDVVQQANVTPFIVKGENTIEIVLSGEARLSAQVAGRCWIPWDRVPAKEESRPLDLQVRYDKSKLARGDVLTARVEMRYRGAATYMVIADLGIPPGFAVEEESFARLVEAKTIDKYSMTGRQITLYFGEMKPGAEVTFEYRLRAKFPLEAKAPRSTAYEYYAPDRSDTAAPQSLEVSE